MMDPLPNWRSTWDIAVSNAFSLSGEIVIKPSSWLDANCQRQQIEN
jgi:hypothetical protein